MIDYAAILTKSPNGVLATSDNGKIKTRVFQYLFSEDGKVYFCTNNQKPVFRQLKETPNVSFCTYAADFSPVLSVNGRAVFVDDLSLKVRALDENPGIKGIYHSAENPVFEIFYILVEEVETFSLSEGAKTYTA